MSDSPLQVAVVGVGHLGRIHARIYAEHPGAELVGVVDVDADRAGELARELGCPAWTDVAALPDRLDAVSVAVPTIAHAEVGVPLLERGVSCLVEKPLACDRADAQRLIDAAERSGATLAVGHVERFQPGVRHVRELGLRPRFIECHRLSMFSFRSLDVGVVHDLMIHDLDLICELMGSSVVELDCAGGAILTDAEDLASARLVFADGGRANVTASRVSLKPMRRFRLFAGDCYVSLDFTKNYGLLVRKGPGWEEGREKLRTLDAGDLAALAEQEDFVTGDLLEVSELELAGEERPLQAELDAFLKSVAAGTPPEVGGADGLRALELADRIRNEIHQQGW